MDSNVDDRLAALTLARSSGIGPIHYQVLVRRFGTPEAALDAIPTLVSAGTLPRVKLAGRQEARRELTALGALGAQVLVIGQKGYPPFLQAAGGAPPILTARGRMDALLKPSIAIVGARNASANGVRFARELAAEVARAGICVVSGLARGIDTAAHEGALEAGGDTVAVIACGVDIAYPEENGPLMERIVRQGAVTSERPLGAAPRAKDFPRRNRIISGLSLGVLVVEAAPQSGSLITARLAAEQGREVMAVPGSPMDPRHRGTNRLLKEGAHLIESAEDVLAIVKPLAIRQVPRARNRANEDPQPCGSPDDVPCECGNMTAADASSHSILEGLGPEPVLVDELIRQCHASPAAVQEALLELELEGRLEWHPGNRVALRVR